MPLSALTVMLSNTMLRRGCGLEWPIGTAEFLLREYVDSEPPAVIWITIGGDIGGFSIGQSTDLLDSILTAFLDGAVFETFSDNLKIAVVSVALDSLLSSLELIADCLMTVQYVGFDEPLNQTNWISLDYEVQFADGRTEPLRLRCEDCMVPSYLELLQQNSPSPRSLQVLRSLLVPVMLRLGSSRVSMIDAMSLEVGDVILVESTAHKDISHVRVQIGSRHATLATLSRDRALIVKVPGGSHLSEIPEEMQELNSADTITVRLDFDVGCAEVSVCELAELKEGYIFDLDKKLGSNVTIRCGWRIVGRGELVNIDDQRSAVRVIELAQSNL